MRCAAIFPLVTASLSLGHIGAIKLFICHYNVTRAAV
jgi:hypothetical protein